MISLADYWMKRDAEFPTAMSPGLEHSASIMVTAANALMQHALGAGVRFAKNPRTGTLVSSGWRPPAVNARTAGAAPNSKHMTGHAIDLYDPDGDIDEWCMSAEGLQAMKAVGIWLEHPAATKSWTHWQSLPPRSGNRVFYP